MDCHVRFQSTSNRIKINNQIQVTSDHDVFLIHINNVFVLLKYSKNVFAVDLGEVLKLYSDDINEYLTNLKSELRALFTWWDK